MQHQPTLLNSCAMAATAAEARFRIDYPDTRARASRIIALDEHAAGVVGRLADHDWRGGHFLVFAHALPVNGSGDEVGDAVLRATDGSEVLLSEELENADVAVLVATADVDERAASLIGDACASRRIMSAGLALSTTAGDVDEAVAALRPNAMVLLVLTDESDLRPILKAMRV